MRLPNIVLEVMQDIESVTDQDLAKAERQLKPAEPTDQPMDYTCQDNDAKALFALTIRYRALSMKRLAESRDADSTEQEKELLVAARHYNDMADIAGELWWGQIGDDVQQDNPATSLGVREGWQIVKNAPQRQLMDLLGGR